MKALIPNRTLKNSPDPSKSAMLAGKVVSGLEERGVELAYNRVAGFVVTGNEDGAESCTSEMASGMVEIGFCVPPLAWTYWDMGPGSE